MKKRSDISNGIWLCSNCHTMIDADEKKYPVVLLEEWKEIAEKRASDELGERPPEIKEEFSPPLELPERPQHFRSRVKEIKKLVEDLKPEKIITLTGPGGISKTSLAAETLWRMTDGENTPGDFPDGVLFHSFYNQTSTDFAFEYLARAFGGEPRPTPRGGAKLALAGKQALLALDGAEAADDLGAVLALRSQCGVLVTSWDRGDIREGWQDLDPLEVEEGSKLLQDWGGMRAKDNDAAWYSVDSLHAQASRTANEVALALRGKASNYALVTPEAARCA